MKETLTKMRKNSKQFAIYTAVLLLFISVATALRTAACFRDLNFSTGYFGSQTLIDVSRWIAVISAVLAFMHLAFGARHTPAPTRPSAISYIPSGAVATAILFLSLELFSSYKARQPITARSASAILELVCGVLALLAIFAFFLDVYAERRENYKKAYFFMAASLLFAVYAAYLYFDTALPINAPNKIAEEMAFLFSAIYFVNEARIALGRSFWRAHTAFGLIATLITVYTSGPALILYFAKGEVITSSPISALLMLLVAVYALMRVFNFKLAPEDEKSEAAKTVDTIYEDRLASVKGEFAIARDDINVENHEGEVQNYEIQLPESEEAYTEEANEDGEI